MFKVNNKDARTTSMIIVDCFLGWVAMLNKTNFLSISEFDIDSYQPKLDNKYYLFFFSKQKYTIPDISIFSECSAVFY